MRKVVEVAKKETSIREVTKDLESTDPVEIARSFRKKMYESWKEKRNR